MCLHANVPQLVPICNCTSICTYQNAISFCPNVIAYFYVLTNAISFCPNVIAYFLCLPCHIILSQCDCIFLYAYHAIPFCPQCVITCVPTNAIPFCPQYVIAYFYVLQHHIILSQCDCIFVFFFVCAYHAIPFCPQYVITCLPTNTIPFCPQYVIAYFMCLPMPYHFVPI